VSARGRLRVRGLRRGHDLAIAGQTASNSPVIIAEATMPRFVIEREIPGAGKLSPQDLQAIAQKSCGVLSGMGPKIQWVESFVTDDKVYCVYVAPDEATVREHARQGGFPANRVAQVRRMIDPTTAE
jgi:hypothetical protein